MSALLGFLTVLVVMDYASAGAGDYASAGADDYASAGADDYVSADADNYAGADIYVINGADGYDSADACPPVSLMLILATAFIPVLMLILVRLAVQCKLNCMNITIIY